MACPQRNVTDRAHRYRAARNAPAGEKRCAFCGAKGRVEVGHIDGHEENGAADNLIWTCRSCNVIAGNTLRKANIGRLTHQYNPKSGGAPNMGAWLQAVSAITPHSEKRGDRQLVSKMKVSDAVAMIRATPESKRSQFAAQLGKHKGRRNPFIFDHSPKAVATARAKYAKMMAKPKKAAKAIVYKGYRIFKFGEVYKSSIDRETDFDTVADAKRFIADEVKMRRNPPLQGIQVIPSIRKKGMFDVVVGGLVRITKKTRRGAEGYANRLRAENPMTSAGEAAAAQRFMSQAESARRAGDSARADKLERLAKSKRLMAELLSSRNPRRRRNSAEGSDLMYEKFHGRESDGEVIVEEDEHIHEHLAVLGQLMEMRIDCVSGYEAILSFDDDPPFLCASEDGLQLYIEAGDQELDLKALKLDGDKWKKDRMVIGRFSPPGIDARDKKPAKWNIGYQTAKEFDEFEEILYQHDLGEETSVNGKTKRVAEEDRVRPLLEYEPHNQKLFITGGQYVIKLPLLGTSPGIEN